MKTYTILALVLSAYLACVSAQYPFRRQAQTGVATAPQTGTDPSMASTLSTYIVDFLTRKIEFLFELFDIKVRAIRFLSSLYTTENLVLLKKVMNVGIRVGNWLYSVIPDSTTESHSYLLSILFPQLNQQENNYQEFSSEDPQQPFSKDEPAAPVVMSTTGANSDEDDAEDEDEDENVLNEQLRSLNNLITAGNRYNYY